MAAFLLAAGLRLRLLYTSLLRRFGFGENAFLMPTAVLIGIVTAAAAVAFHELIVVVREALYHRSFAATLYGRGILLLIVYPALGGLVVGTFSTYVMRAREGHGVVDVMETVIRSSGVIRPISAVEKILTSAVTIGTGGSAGAEGPIVQIGAGISSMFGQFFQVPRSLLPVLIGCGTAAGISAIFNSPIGGVLFTLEVILFDFSLRTFTPVVLASVVANVTTKAIFHVLGGEQTAIFSVANVNVPPLLHWQGVSPMILLGLACGLAGVTLTRAMYASEERFRRLPVPRALRPALGGALLGVLGVMYVMIFGWLLLGRDKPFDFHHYPMPAFYGDGYGVVQQLIVGSFFADSLATWQGAARLCLVLGFLCLAKIVGTCLTLSSGGSGGVIAPSLFLGATTGSLVGIALHLAGVPGGMDVGFYALIGMGAALAAVVHAPLAAILILVEVTAEQRIIVPAMLACVVAAGTAQVLFRDSVYTLALRRRGLRPGAGGDLLALRRLTVEQVPLDPVTSIGADQPFERLLDLSTATGVSDFVVLDRAGGYAGMVTADELKAALIDREAIPLLTVGEVARSELPCVRSGDDLATVLEAFGRHEVPRLPVCLGTSSSRIIGLISRRALMARYHAAISER